MRRFAVGGAVAAAFGALALSCAPADSQPGEEGRPLHRDAARFSGLPEHPSATASSAFWERWGDGRAELSGYRLVTERYGEPREGELVLVYVTEPHDRRTWIKDDHATDPDRVEVLKLLESRTFLTGVYPYSATTAVFSPVDDWGGERFSPVRLVGSVHEWCGSWHLRLWPGDGALRSVLLSYFAREGEVAAERPLPTGTLYEDALLIQLRELDGPFAAGGDWEGALVPALWAIRAEGREAAPSPATIRRESGERAGVPVTRFVLRQGDRIRTFDVERAAPRRVLVWTVEESGRMVERAELRDSRRMAYWERNRPGDEELRASFGLDPAGGLPDGSPPEGR